MIVTCPSMVAQQMLTLKPSTLATILKLTGSISMGPWKGNFICRNAWTHYMCVIADKLCEYFDSSSFCRRFSLKILLLLTDCWLIRSYQVLAILYITTYEGWSYGTWGFSSWLRLDFCLPKFVTLTFWFLAPKIFLFNLYVIYVW